MKKNRAVFVALMAVLTITACEPQIEHDDDGTIEVTEEGALGSTLVQAGKADGPQLIVPSDFPRKQDIAVLVPMDMEPPIQGNLETASGRDLLREGWLNQVSDAFLGTDVEDALDRENFYEDWRLVSLRVATCGPLGRFPGEVPDGVCWPQVRLVWQPVLEDYFLGWIFADRYGDDRAIHSLYRVHPTDSAEGFHPALAAMQAQIASEEGFGGATPALMEAFYNARDRALLRLTNALIAMRGEAPLYSSWDELDMRAEYGEGPEKAMAFHQNLYGFLWTFAEPMSLHELTAFSLPEGRSPSSIDSWVFLAFDGVDGEIVQRDITVRSKTDGRIIANLGLDQTVSTSSEDPELEEAVANDPLLAEELKGTVFMSIEDEQMFADVIADPTQTFVHNTTCATCHRLTDIRFDFHTFSYFEDRAATVSPRVEGDVAFDLGRLEGFVNNLATQ